MTLSSDQDFMAYVRNDFVDAWDRYLPQPSAVDQRDQSIADHERGKSNDSGLTVSSPNGAPSMLRHENTEAQNLSKRDLVAAADSPVAQEATRTFAIGAD